MTGKLLLCVLVALALFSQTWAQGPDNNADAEKEKAARWAKLFSAVAEEAAQLKLPENRAFINVKIGTVVWKTDEERARKLFRNAVNDLIAAQQAAEASKNPGQFYDLLNSQSARPMILGAIAAMDAEFALEALYRTRPANVERALAAASPNLKIGANNGNYAYLAQNEINLEQRLIRQAAEQKPERAVALLRDAVKKKLSGETLNLLQNILQKDAVAANELANDVLDRLVAAEFVKSEQPNYELVNLSNSVLADFLRERSPEEKYLKFNEAGVQRLTVKVISIYLKYGQQMGYVPIEQLGPAIKRFSPQSYEPLLKVVRSPRLRGHGIYPADPEYTKLMESNPSADVLVTAAKGFDQDTQRSIYQSAANKYSETGQYQAGIALLNEKMEGEALDNAVSSMNWYYAHHLMQKGEYDAAESVMMEFNESNRVSGLITLATTVFNANKDENRGRAAAILNRVRGLLPERPQNSTEMSQYFSLIGAAAPIDPAESFRTMESLIEQINQLSEAYALVNSFQGGNVRQNEFMLSGGFNFGIYVDANIFRMLAQSDFDRALNVINAFSRRELRLLMLMHLLENPV